MDVNLEEILVFVDTCATSFYETHQNHIQIFPNPTSEDFFIDINSPNFYNVEIYDVVGRLIYYKDKVNSLIKIKTIRFSKGTYFIKMITPSAIITNKIIIDR